MKLLWRKTAAGLLFLAVVLSSGSLPAGAQQRLAGVVVDSSGAVIAGARLVFTAPGYRAAQTSASDGTFVFDSLPIARGRLRITALGFAEQEFGWSATTAQPLRIALQPAPVTQQLTVSATRTATRLTDTAASVVVLGASDIASAGAVTLDDTLRQAPGFILFRRSGSLAANPTSQGVSLRGVGASGASRALVLYDGVPLNDPFGGWVYWDRVPDTAIAGLEVLRGGASDLYGTGAMGGVVDVLPRRPETSALTVESFLGNHLTPEGSLFASQRINNWSLSASGDAFRTNGYLLVNAHDRGAVDTPATVDHRTGRLGVERIFSAGRVFVSGSLFREGRNNGTVAQINNTRLGEIITGGDWTLQRAGTLTVRLYGSGQRFFQTFSSVAANRNSEALIRAQVSPAQREGLSAYWSRPVKSQHTLVAGVESQDVRGHSNETAIASGIPTSIQDSGGRQRVTGVFFEDIYRPTTNWVLTGGLRMDAWRNFDAFSHVTTLSNGKSTLAALAERSESAFSPHVSLLRRVNSHFSLAASGYRAFRAPTLNELYRSFRVGNRLTQANDQLRAERLSGGEAGGILNISRLTLRATVFVADVTRPVANVTLSTTPALITQQRQNLGRTGTRGLELQGEAHVTSTVTLSGGYQFVSATVLDFSANRALEGLNVPQTPRHQFSLQARYFNPRRLLLSAQARYAGIQFDDDQNLLPLDRFFTVDAYASRALNRYLEVFAAAENLLGQRYMVGRTPTTTWSPPILARVGVRVEVGGR